MARQGSLIQVRVDESVKTKADALFAELGFDTPTAIRIFLNQAISREGMPFEVVKLKPNTETIAVMLNGMERIPRQYNNFKEILAEVDAEIEAEGGDEV